MNVTGQDRITARAEMPSLSELEARMAELEAGAVEIRARLAELEARMTKLEASAAEIKAGMAKLKADVDSVFARQDNFELLLIVSERPEIFKTVEGPVGSR